MTWTQSRRSGQSEAASRNLKFVQGSGGHWDLIPSLASDVRDKKASMFVGGLVLLLLLFGAEGTRSRYDDARIANELGRLLKLPPRYADFQLEYPLLSKNGVTLEGVTYGLDDFSLPWRLVRHYAQMQLSTYKMAAGNPVMRAAIARHNAERMTSFLGRVELAGTAQFAYSNVHVVQASGLVSEVNAYVVLSLVAALVLLFTVYSTYIMASHLCRLLVTPSPTGGPPEQAHLLAPSPPRDHHK